MATQEEIQKIAKEYYNTPDSKEYEREKGALKNKLAIRLIEYFKENHSLKYKEYEDAYYEGIAKAIKIFEPDKGYIVHLAAVNISDQIKHDNSRSSSVGHLPKKDMKNWKYLKIQVRAVGKDFNILDDVLYVVKKLDIDIGEDEVIKAFAVRKGIKEEDGEIAIEANPENTYNRIDSKENLERRNIEFEDDIFYELNQFDVFEKMDKFFVVQTKRQNSNKELLSAVLTHFCYEKLAALPSEKLAKLDFVDKKIYTLCSSSEFGKKDLTDMLGVSQGAYTQKYKRFFEDFKKYLERE